MNKSEFPSAREIQEILYQEIVPADFQKNFIKEISSIYSYHIKRHKLIESGYSKDLLPFLSAIIVAPTGSGKTFILKKMAELNGINLISIDGSTLAKEGWKGVSLSKHLISVKDFKNTPTILFIDEADKLKLCNSTYDEGNAQVNLLQLYSHNFITAETSDKDIIQIDVSKLSVILAGAFSGLDNIIADRLSICNEIGFTKNVSSRNLSTSELMENVIPEDLVKFGLMRELISRIGTIITIPSLTVKDYIQLITAEHGSIIEKYNNYFNSFYGITFEISDAAAEHIATKCTASPNGARSISPIIDAVMRKAIAYVDIDKNVNKIVLSVSDNNLFLDYQHGKRKAPLIQSSYTEYTETYLMPAESTEALVEKLINIYFENNSNKADCELLKSYLHCTLYFLKHNCEYSDFTLSSVIRLVHTVERTENVCSVYNYMMEDAFKRRGNDIKQALLLGNFNSMFTNEVHHKLVLALNKIDSVLKHKYHCGNIQFRIE